MPDILDKFGKSSIDTDYAIATTVKTTRVSGVAVLEAFDLSRFADDTPVFFVTYKKTTDPLTDVVSVTNLVSWKALVNVGANTLTNLTLAPGYTDDGNDVGDFIECIPTSYWENSLIDGLLATLNPDGTLKTDIVEEANLAPSSVTADKIDWNMWLEARETWTYVSASTFTVPGDQTTKYTPATRLKFTQTTVKYATVRMSSYSAPNTTVTIVVNTDFTIANAAITDNFFSYAGNPQGYPEYFNYTATRTGFSSGTIVSSRYSITNNGRVFVDYRWQATGANVTGDTVITLPVNVNSTMHANESPLGTVTFLDTGTVLYYGYALVSANSALLRPIDGSATYGRAGTCSASVPMIWASGDTIGTNISYQMG